MALALLIVTGHASIWVLYAVMFTVMTCEVFYDLAGRAMLPDIAPAGSLDRANSRLVGGQTVTQQFAGGPLAGFLFAVAAFLPLAVNAGAYVLGALVLLGLPLAVRRPQRPEGREETGREAGGGLVRSVLADVREGLVFVFRGSSLGPIMGFNVVVNLAFMAQSGVLVLLAREHFGVPAALYGVFIGTSAVGALLGASTVSAVVARLGRFRTELLLFTLAGVCCVAFGLAPDPYVAAVAWAVIGYAMTSSNIVLISAIQLIVPGGQMGRVMSCVQMFGGGFGCKVGYYADETLCAWAAVRVVRPVRLVLTRREDFLTTTQGRGQVNEVEAAVDEDGTVRALRCWTLADLGAYLETLTPYPGRLTGRLLTGPYRIPAAAYELVSVFTTAMATAPYRGGAGWRSAGCPEASWR